jgi:TctA family transporter
VTRPISLGLLVLAVAVLIAIVVPAIRRGRASAFSE